MCQIFSSNFFFLPTYFTHLHQIKVVLFVLVPLKYLCRYFKSCDCCEFFWSSLFRNTLDLFRHFRYMYILYMYRSLVSHAYRMKIIISKIIACEIYWCTLYTYYTNTAWYKSQQFSHNFIQVYLPTVSIIWTVYSITHESW